VKDGWLWGHRKTKAATKQFEPRASPECGSAIRPRRATSLGFCLPHHVCALASVRKALKRKHCVPQKIDCTCKTTYADAWNMKNIKAKRQPGHKKYKSTHGDRIQKPKTHLQHGKEHTSTRGTPREN
jgi:hypothetical protein